MTEEQKQVLRTLDGHEFGRIVRKLGQGGLGAAYLTDLTNPLQILASRMTYGDESPQLFGLADIPYNEQDPQEITNPEHRKRIHDAAHKVFIENGPPHDKKPAAALETYIMMLEAINKTLPKHKHEDHFDVVVKILKRRTESDKDIEKILNEDARKRFIQEAKVLKKLDHPNIVKLFGMVDARSIGTCLVLEYVDGESLDAYLQKQPDHRIPPEQAVDMMLSLLEAVDYMHKQKTKEGKGIIHRDIKPSNILLRADRTPVIIDFGIVKDPETDQTIVGTRMGTPAYMPPDFIKDGITKENTTPAADIYSLGLVFFEMLAGRRAYEGNQEEIFKEAVKPRHPTKLTAFTGSISDELVYCVEGARAKSIEDRYTMEQFRAKLEEIKEKKLYGRPSPRPSTTIWLQKEQARVGANCKSDIIQKKEIDEELESRKTEDRTAHVERYLAQIKSTRVEIGLYSQARKELDDFIKYNPVTDTALMHKVNDISEIINKGLAHQEARKHLGETRRLIKAQDIVGAEGALKEAEKHVAALPENEHPELHAEFKQVLDGFDTKYRLGASAVKSLQSAVDSVRSQYQEACGMYCERKPVEQEKLSTMAKQIDDTESLAAKIAGVAEMPLYKELHKEAQGLKGSLNKLKLYCAESSALAGISDLCEGMLALGVVPERGQVNRLVADFDSAQSRIAQIEPEKKSRLYETIAARVKEVHGKLESLINKV